MYVILHGCVAMVMMVIVKCHFKLVTNTPKYGRVQYRLVLVMKLTRSAAIFVAKYDEISFAPFTLTYLNVTQSGKLICTDYSHMLETMI